MTLQTTAMPPFIVVVNGYTLPASLSGAKATDKTGSNTAITAKDIVDIKVTLPCGTFTTEAGDALAVRDLFDAGSGAARYRVALRDDPDTPGGGKLLLAGKDVTGQVDFSPAEFQQLQFQAGPDGASSDLVVVARNGKPDGRGGLQDIIDSPALQITAQTTGTRSINAAVALRTRTAASDGEANVTRIVQESNIFSGFGATRPALNTPIRSGELQLSPDQLATRAGGSRQAGKRAGGQPTDISALFNGSVGRSQSSVSTQSAATSRAAVALAALLSNGVGGFGVASGSPAQTSLALQAYQRSIR